MGKVLNTDALVSCGHVPGLVTLVPAGTKMKVSGKEVVVESMLKDAVISGCSNVVSPNTACFKVVSVDSGKATKLNIGGEDAILKDALFTTDGSDPNSGEVLNAGQTKLDSA